MPMQLSQIQEKLGIRLNRTYYCRFESPVGSLLLAGSKAGLALVSFSGGKRARNVDSEWYEDNSVFTEVVDQLKSYFAGERKAFDLPLVLEGTEFQKKVWTSLVAIPYGETVSYKTLAERVGSPKAVRAVGAANARRRKICRMDRQRWQSRYRLCGPADTRLGAALS